MDAILGDDLATSHLRRAFGNIQAVLKGAGPTHWGVV